MSEFEVLDRLARGERAPMQELAEAVHLSQSALSRTVGRLEKDGLVSRDVPGGPARRLRLPDRGRPRALRGGAPAHRAVLAETLEA